jgi:hypothetical protein
MGWLSTGGSEGIALIVCRPMYSCHSLAAVSHVCTLVAISTIDRKAIICCQSTGQRSLQMFIFGHPVSGSEHRLSALASEAPKAKSAMDAEFGPSSFSVTKEMNPEQSRSTVYFVPLSLESGTFNDVEPAAFTARQSVRDSVAKTKPTASLEKGGHAKHVRSRIDFWMAMQGLHPIPQRSEMAVSRHVHRVRLRKNA